MLFQNQSDALLNPLAKQNIIEREGKKHLSKQKSAYISAGFRQIAIQKHLCS